MSILDVFGPTFGLLLLVGCSSCMLDLESVRYTPLQGGDWPVSTPQEQDLDPMLVARMYAAAARLDTIYGLLVIKNGYLVAEDYWHGSGVADKCPLESVTKSYVGALVGLAIHQGYIESIDQPVMDYFPELEDQVSDQRKRVITIRHLLQMRAGYPWEEASAELFTVLWHEGFRPSDLVRFPLIRDPGTDHDYSNLSSHLLGIIVSRATGMDLREFGEQELFSLIDSEVGDWEITHGYYRNGHGRIEFSARDAAKFGQLYLDGGVFDGEQVVPAAWVADSLQTYSEDAWDYRIGRNIKDMGYGYQWWSVRSGDHRYNMAWGHGGQLIVLLHDVQMVIVATADPFVGQSDNESWRQEKANINLVANFIASLPSE